MKWKKIILPEDLSAYSKKIKQATFNSGLPTELEYRIRKKNGEIKWVREAIRQTPEITGKKGKFQGSVHDITERKLIMRTLEEHEEARIKEIHHRIKNNLQVISSLLDLQADRFSEQKSVQTHEVLEAFKDSRNRVISMALIHEELYKSKDMITLDFASYLQKLTNDFLNTYTLDNKRVNLKLDLESVYLDMDTAIPLGIIVNELVSNTLKHAFQLEKQGEISIKLNSFKYTENTDENRAEVEGYSGATANLYDTKSPKSYELLVSDNGPGIPAGIDLKNTDSLGLQLVTALVDQIEGQLEMRRKPGAAFKISFSRP